MRLNTKTDLLTGCQSQCDFDASRQSQIRVHQDSRTRASLRESTPLGWLRRGTMSLPAATPAVDSARSRLDPPGSSPPNGLPAITELPLMEDRCEPSFDRHPSGARPDKRPFSGPPHDYRTLCSRNTALSRLTAPHRLPHTLPASSRLSVPLDSTSHSTFLWLRMKWFKSLSRRPLVSGTPGSRTEINLAISVDVPTLAFVFYPSLLSPPAVLSSWAPVSSIGVCLQYLIFNMEKR
jgi:hypothetical protein